MMYLYIAIIDKKTKSSTINTYFNEDDPQDPKVSQRHLF